MRFVADMEVHVIVGGLDPIDIARLDENDATAGFDSHALEGLGLGFDLGEEHGDALIEFAGSLLADAIFCAFKGRLKTLTIERLKKKIQGVDLKSFQRELVVGGHENDDRNLVRIEIGQ